MRAAAMLEPYLSPCQRERSVRALAERMGGELHEYGTSVQGRPLQVVRLPAQVSARGPTPRLLCCAGIHGVEYIAPALAMACLQQADASPIVGLRERAELWIAPCLNPDGYARTWAAGGRGRLAELRTNARGVDLNRNYPIPGGASPRNLPWAGSARPGSANFRGESPLSEPETYALDRLFTDVGFHAGLNLHSFMGTVIPARVTDRSSYATYISLARSFAQAQPGTRYRRLAHRKFDLFTGEQEDHQHHARRTWAACIETFTVVASLRQHLRAPSLFWRFNPRQPERWIANDLPGIAAYFARSLELPPLPSKADPPSAGA
ncbi:MAG: hypothetical protein B7733_17740 [Myxococcales bacterium FL481]|nr:MAG: hypothetical protein B7733_17740 [Myxococcales bacterium FL481]